jgi:hypothetical protein
MAQEASCLYSFLEEKFDKKSKDTLPNNFTSKNSVLGEKNLKYPKLYALKHSCSYYLV